MSLPHHKCAWVVAGLLLLLSCHDAPRNNPFDPALTPPVELQVALDDTAGTATLTWSRYAGKQPFEEYRVLRNIAERTRVDTLVHLPTVAQTTFVDTTLAPNTPYVYWVEVVNAEGYAAPSEEKGIAGFSVGAVRLLEVESDPRSGGLVLRWNRYVGPDFAEYQVRRRAVGTDREEMLAEIAVPTDTTFTDQTAQAGVDYLYTLTVQAAGQELESNSQEGRLVLPGVALLAPEFSSATASASLKWTAYEGPRFKAYRVERHTAELAAQVIKETRDIADTALVDPGLLGNTEYFYQVVVETKRDEEVESAEQRGRFHALVQSWPLKVEEGEYVRLYWEEDRLTALVAGPGRVQLRFFDPQGQLLGEQILLENPFADDPLFGQWSPPQAVATALLPDGSRLLSFADRSGELLGVLEFDAGGELVWGEEQLLSEGEVPTAAVEQESYLGEWGLSAFNRQPFNLFGSYVAAAFTSAEVEVDGQVQMQDSDFARAEQWTSIVSPPTPAAGNPSAPWIFGNGRAAAAGTSVEPLVSIRTFKIHQGAWRRFAMRAQVVVMRGGASIYISPDGTARRRLTLALDVESRQALLAKGASAPLEWLFPVLVGLPYRLRLEADEGAFSAYVAHPFYWSGETTVGGPLAGLAQFGDFVGVVAGNQPFILDPEAKAEEKLPLDRPVSEMRSWARENRGRRETWAGLCLPEQHQIRCPEK